MSEGPVVPPSRAQREAAQKFDMTPEGIAARQAKGKSDTKSALGCGFIILIIIAIIVIAVSNGGSDDSSGDDDSGGDEPSQSSLDLSAYRACEDFVESRLKSPGTADFSGIFSLDVSHAASDYTVRLTVDSENGFGALIRTGWTCEMTLSGETWRSTSVVQTSG